MTKSEVAVVVTAATAWTVNDIVHATAANDATLPLPVTLVGVIVIPALILIAVVWLFAHVNAKGEDTREEVIEEIAAVRKELSAKVDILIAKQDALLALGTGAIPRVDDVPGVTSAPGPESLV